LGYDKGSSGNFLPTFWDNLSVPSSFGEEFEFFTLEDGTDNISKKLPLLTV